MNTNCNRRGVLFSTVQGKQVEMTTADIAAAFKCNDEHPPVDAQMDEQPESFYISEIIEDMCVGQYADDKNNMGSRSKLPPQLWLVDSILQRIVCPLGHKSTPFIKAIGIPSHQSFGIKLTSFGKECIGTKPQLPIHGGYHFHFCSHIS
jgi:hypothetical protein